MGKKRFELWEVENEGFHFKFIAGNGETVFTSEWRDPYSSAQMARKGIAAAKKCFDAPIVKGAKVRDVSTSAPELSERG